jgi:diaminopimelate epimerase
MPQDRRIKFTKMHGLGNNYIFVDLFEETLREEELGDLAVRAADVHTGIGADGLILIGPSERADFRMRIFNADGSEGKNCGNGLRCVAKYVVERGLTDRHRFTIETLGGIVRVDAHVDAAGRVPQVTVDMGEPRLRKRDLPMLGDPDSETIDEAVNIGGATYRLTGVSMGNPHAVLFVPDAAAAPVAEVGPLIERSPLFPERVNVEFISVRSETEIDFRVWERGSGITQACGTGACAAVVAGVLNGRLKRGEPVTVHLAGGDLVIVWKEDGRVLMTGPAETTADGVYYYRTVL